MAQLLKQRAALGCWGIIEGKETLPIKAHHRENSTKLNDKREGMDKGIALRNTQKILCDNHVPRRRYRKKLRQSFNDGDDNGFNPIHYILLFSTVS